MSSEAARAAPRDRLLGELLLDAGLLGASDLERGLLLQQKMGGRLGSVLMRIGAVSEDNLLQILSRQLGLPVMGAEVPAPDEDAMRLTALQAPTGIDWLLDQQVLVWPGEGNDLLCAARDPLLPSLREAMRHAFPGRRVHWCLCRAQDLERMLDGLAHHARSDEWSGGDEQQLRAMAEEAPVVELVSNLMAQAVEQRASDIHLEPEERTFSVRFRIDGVLHNRLHLPRDRFDAVASRLKLISGMDIAERRLPQDGRMSTRVGGQEMDIRVSALPGVHGESIVMRLLPKERKELGLEKLGFESDHLALMKEWTAEANGIVLVTGPTGSGKSTTLYASLAAANDGLKKIITVEDPVEFQLPAITQIQAHPDIGLTFANALRSILRQDPDVIMIGEIRDLETCRIAIQSALTGHLVLSTLHTNSAAASITRLLDMGVESYLIASTVNGILAQRLVRRLDPETREAFAAPEQLIKEHGLDRFTDERPIMLYRPRSDAPGGGYHGRSAITELLVMNEELRSLLMRQADATTLENAARRGGLRTLYEEGLRQAVAGVTSLEEVLRVTRGDGA